MNKQQQRKFMFSGSNKIPNQPQTFSTHTQIPSTGPSLQYQLSTIVNLIINRRFGESIAEISKTRMNPLNEMVKLAYQLNLFKHIIFCKDKILQVNPDTSLLPQGSMPNLRAIANMRQQAISAKINYQLIVQNLKKLLIPSSFYQCTIPNRKELHQIKSSLFDLFKELKNLRRNQHQSIASSTAGSNKQNNLGFDWKEMLLDVITLVIPTQTLHNSSNRQKSVCDLFGILRESIKDTFEKNSKEFDLLQSTAKTCQKSLQNEYKINLQKAKQIKSLQEQLYASQKIIQQLEGQRAVTQMQNLGLHSKIKSTKDIDDLIEIQTEIERLKIQKEEMDQKIRQNGFQKEYMIFRIEKLKEENEKLKASLNESLKEKQQQLKQIEQGLIMEIQQLKNANNSLLQSIQIKKDQIETLSLQITNLHKRNQHIQDQYNNLKQQFNVLQRQTLIYQQNEHNLDDYIQEITKLKEQFELAHAQIHRLKSILKQDEQQKAKYDHIIEQMHKTIYEDEENKQRLKEQMEELININDGFRISMAETEAKMITIHEQFEYLQAQKEYYQNYYKQNNQKLRQQIAINTLITLQDLKTIETSIVQYSQMEVKLQESYQYNAILMKQIEQYKQALIQKQEQVSLMAKNVLRNQMFQQQKIEGDIFTGTILEDSSKIYVIGVLKQLTNRFISHTQLIFSSRQTHSNSSFKQFSKDEGIILIVKTNKDCIFSAYSSTQPACQSLLCSVTSEKCFKPININQKIEFEVSQNVILFGKNQLIANLKDKTIKANLDQENTLFDMANKEIQTYLGEKQQNLISFDILELHRIKYE